MVIGLRKFDLFRSAHGDQPRRARPWRLELWSSTSRRSNFWRSNIVRLTLCISASGSSTLGDLPTEIGLLELNLREIDLGELGQEIGLLDLGHRYWSSRTQPQRSRL